MEKDQKLNISEESLNEVVETTVKETEEEGLMADANVGCVNASCALA